MSDISLLDHVFSVQALLIYNGQSHLFSRRRTISDRNILAEHYTHNQNVTVAACRILFSKRFPVLTQTFYFVGAATTTDRLSERIGQSSYGFQQNGMAAIVCPIRPANGFTVD